MSYKEWVTLLALALFCAPASIAEAAVAAEPGSTFADGAALEAASNLRFFRSYVIQGDYVAKGVGMRNFGRGKILIDEIPADAKIVAAYLYFTILDDADPVEAIVDAGGQIGVVYRDNVAVNFVNARFDTIVRIGSSDSPCWSPDFAYSYRLDVTASVAPGSHEYELRFDGGNSTGLLSGSTGGEDPWLYGGLQPMMEGATLVIVYSHDDLPLTQIVLYDGNFLYLGTGADTSMEVYEQGEDTLLRTTFIGADGQASTAGPNSTVDGTLVSATWEGDDENGPGSSYSFGNLWDTMTIDGLALTGGSQTVTPGLQTGSGFIDCVVWVAQVVAVRQTDPSTCSVPMYLGSDTNVDEEEGLFPANDCRRNAPHNREVFYAGRLGTVEAAAGSPFWSCCIRRTTGRQDCVDGELFSGERTCQFDLPAARSARSVRTYAYWGLFGPNTAGCGGAECPMTQSCVEAGLGSFTVGGVAAENQKYARFGACQAEEFGLQLERYSRLVGGEVMFADIEEMEAWATCSTTASADCERNQAVLLGFFRRAQQLGYTPGVYTRADFWNQTMDRMGDRRYPWDPGIDFVLWITGGAVSCRQDRSRAVKKYPQGSLGGMRPVIWQYVERAEDCKNDYDITLQDPRSFHPERLWYGDQRIFSRDPEPPADDTP